MAMPLSENYTLTTGGRAVDVFHTDSGDFAVVCFSGFTEIVVTAKNIFKEVFVRPLGKNYGARTYGNEIRLTLTDRDRVSVEPYGLKNPLFIFCAKYIEQPANATHIFKRGTVTQYENLELTSGDCVYIEEGAQLISHITANRAKNIEITGNGILWGLPLHPPERSGVKFIKFSDCDNVRMSGVTITDSPAWNVVPIACRNVEIDGINIIGMLGITDGIDVVGCSDVNIKHCFICVNDDCIVLKASRTPALDPDFRGARDIKNVRASDCVLWKKKCGNAIEIGYETSCNEISDISFEDIDIIHCEPEGWQSGAVFSIHLGDRAHIHDVRYKNIRVEDAGDKLIDLKIQTYGNSLDTQRGEMDGILFDGIYVLGGVLPPSIIRGFEDMGVQKIIRDVRVSNLFLNGERVAGKANAHVIAELTAGIVFE
ncbi:MAG: glycosyl hydrolase family 28 protein [Defluviitaleaceae bacterium]|nr:glycosyl hydrolase family 28 protein [Defluviitaleaceae bacterium]